MVKWTSHAKRQLLHIHDYIAHDSPMYAKRVSEELIKTTIGLDELPRCGRSFWNRLFFRTTLAWTL